MLLTILGASPSFPNPGGACAGYLLEEGPTSLLLDCGHGVCSRLLRAADPRRLSACLITHMHPDHFFDLVPLMYAYRFVYSRDAATPLFLPPGGSEVFRKLASAANTDWRAITETYQIEEYDPNAALEIGSLGIQFAPTRHFVPGYAVRIVAQGSPQRPLVFTSDTAPTAELAALSRGADLLLAEASILSHAPDEVVAGHMTATEAGELARDVAARRLVLTHYSQLLAADLLRDAAFAFTGLVELAVEGETYTI